VLAAVSLMKRHHVGGDGVEGASKGQIPEHGMSTIDNCNCLEYVISNPQSRNIKVLSENIEPNRH